MKVKEKIGIVGQGYVGTAIKVGFESYYSLETYDKFDKDKSTCDLNELVTKCGIIFVCVPTPMKVDGSCHTGIVESVVREINDNFSKEKPDPIKDHIEKIINAARPDNTRCILGGSLFGELCIFGQQIL